MLSSMNKYRDFGILILRIGVSLIFIFIHGLPKISGGPAGWAGLGKAMSGLGINFAPEFWGFMSAFTEFFVPFLILLGFLFRPAALLLAINMIVALSTHFIRMDPWNKIAYPMMLFILFISLFLIGPGRYSIDEYLARKKMKKE